MVSCVAAQSGMNPYIVLQFLHPSLVQRGAGNGVTDGGKWPEGVLCGFVYAPALEEPFSQCLIFLKAVKWREERICGEGRDIPFSGRKRRERAGRWEVCYAR